MCFTDSPSLLCDEDVGKEEERPYFGGQKENMNGVQEEKEREKRVQEQKKEMEEKVVEQPLQVEVAAGAVDDDGKRDDEDLDGGDSPFFLQDEEDPVVAQAESGLLAVCGEEDYFHSVPPTDGPGPIAQPVCPVRIQPPRPQKRLRSSSPMSETPPLLPLQTTEPDPPAKPPPKVVGLGDYQPLQVKFTQVYTTRRYTRYTARGQGAFMQYPALPVGEGNEVLRLEDSIDPALMPPKPKKKMRTLYTTGKRSRSPVNN